MNPSSHTRAYPILDIPWKHHTKGVKLYLLCDAQDRYIWHVYLYRRAMPRDNVAEPNTWAENCTLVEIVHLWHYEAPWGSNMLVADTNSDSRETARSLAAQCRLFLMLIPKLAAPVQEPCKGLVLGEQCWA